MAINRLAQSHCDDVALIVKEGAFLDTVCMHNTIICGSFGGNDGKMFFGRRLIAFPL
jgi:hypothetical protein